MSFSRLNQVTAILGCYAYSKFDIGSDDLLVYITSGEVFGSHLRPGILSRLMESIAGADGLMRSGARNADFFFEKRKVISFLVEGCLSLHLLIFLRSPIYGEAKMARFHID